MESMRPDRLSESPGRPDATPPAGDKEVRPARARDACSVGAA
jgi:hypothetical protein